jgi:ribosomal protein S9
MLTAEARRRGEQANQAGVELDIPGVESWKPFRILIGVEGGGVTGQIVL